MNSCITVGYILCFHKIVNNLTYSTRSLSCPTINYNNQYYIHCNIQLSAITINIDVQITLLNCKKKKPQERIVENLLKLDV